MSLHSDLPAPQFASVAAEGDEESVRVREANHRIANNLSILGALVRSHAHAMRKSPGMHASEEVAAILGELSHRIETVGTLHRLFARPMAADTIELTSFLRAIVESAVESLAAADTFVLSFAAPTPCFVSGQDALSLGFIVGELVTNSVKYAHPTGVKGSIELRIEIEAGGDLVVAVWDDGVGMPEGVDPARAGGLGFTLLRSMTARLNGALSFRDAGIGLVVEVRIPMARWRTEAPERRDAGRRPSLVEARAPGREADRTLSGTGLSPTQPGRV